MTTIRDLLQQLVSGQVTLGQAVDRLEAGEWPRPTPPASDDLEAFAVADEIAVDNDPYWVDEAFSSHVIDENEYLLLRNAIRTSWLT